MQLFIPVWNTWCSNIHGIKYNNTVGYAGFYLNMKKVFSGIGISFIKIRQSWDNLLFIMGISIPVSQHLHTELAPRFGIKNRCPIVIQEGKTVTVNSKKSYILWFTTHHWFVYQELVCHWLWQDLVLQACRIALHYCTEVNSETLHEHHFFNFRFKYNDFDW